MSIRLGLDFGTSNSSAAVLLGNDLRLLSLDPAAPSPEVARSILYLTRSGTVHIAQEAIDFYYQHNVGRIRQFTRKRVGEVDVVAADMFYVRDVYAMVDENAPGRLLQYLKTTLRTPHYGGTRIFERFYSPAELTGLYLGELRRRVGEALGEPVREAVIGRPVHLASGGGEDSRAEDALREAAGLAGFERAAFFPEPAAAALDYSRDLRAPQTILVFDFGGGTLDVIAARVAPGELEPLASGGLDLAGSDFDRLIIDRRMLRFFGQGQFDAHPDLRDILSAVEDWMALPEKATPQNRHRLQQAAAAGLAPLEVLRLEALIFNDLAFSFYRMVEQTKIDLSSAGVALARLQEPNLDLWMLYTRSQFERDIQQAIAQVRGLVLQVTAEAGLEPPQIQAVVATGGSSAIPAFRGMLEGVFGPGKLRLTNAFTSVAAGLALQAARLPTLPPV